jgi:tetratricopeptide (TPR) repeat protein
MANKWSMRVAYSAILVAFVAGITSNALADSAQDCEQDKDIKLKLQGCTQFLNGSPPPAAQATALLYRGWAYERLGQYDAAVVDLTKSIGIDPSANAYRLRGAAYEMRQNYDLAIADFNKVMSLKPDFVEAYLYRGDCLLAKGDTASAVADFDLVIQKKPDLVASYFMRARAKELLNQHDGAIADLTYVMSLDPKVKAAALFYRGLANEAKGSTDLAESDFTAAIGLNARLEFERRWAEYLKSIQADGDYANWSDKPYDLYLRLGGL